ncbi:MAG TPA: thrombospondin type 3 repeat-containing protein [Solimonas sp.]
MKKTRWIALAATLWAATASAQDAGKYDQRWYVSPSIGGVFSDKQDMNSGIAGSVSVGRALGRYTGFEIEGNYSSLSVSSLPAEKDYERLTLGANLLQYFANDKADIRPFAIASVNAHSIDFLGEKLSGAGVGLGLGSMFQMSPWWDLRFQARYNLDFISQEGIVQDATFYLWDVGLGFRYKFGADPNDSDGDGVPDSLDKCPNTPKGVSVYSDGCPVDTDGDGVPDYLDKCPGTPKGTVVNASGCPADSDGDGVPDELDKCPNTPRGVMVGPDGCPIDSDGDGIPDAYDKCPNTPKGTIVGPDGCPATDSDGDGIPDFMDKCPATPKGVAVGPDGCPLDSDGDGIPDYLDECPRTPPGAKVLPNGCALTGDCRTPRPGEAVDANGCALDKNFILRGVKFEFDSDRLTEPAKLILNEVGETLKAYPAIRVDLEGHTDSVGSDNYNLGLSERRANAVKTYLAGRGIPGNRMNPVGYGETRPIDSNDTEIGREENRRVELKVLE